jgi:hypothetical protein
MIQKKVTKRGLREAVSQNGVLIVNKRATGRKRDLRIWSDPEDVLPLLKEVESAWSSNSLYFSEPVSRAVNDYLGARLRRS